jgi:hypothetical protein
MENPVFCPMPKHVNYSLIVNHGRWATVGSTCICFNANNLHNLWASIHGWLAIHYGIVAPKFAPWDKPS